MDPLDSGDALEWWSLVTGDLPESSEGSPREQRESHRGTVALAGVELPLSLSVEPSRVDWRITLLPPFTAADFTTGGVLEALGELGTRWLHSAPPVRRLAVGTGVVHAVPEEEALAVLSQITGIPLLGATGDFLFQVNRQRPSHSLEGVPINRLAKFSVMAMQVLRIAIAFLVRTGADGIVAIANDVLNELREFTKESSLALIRLLGVAAPRSLEAWAGWLLTRALRSADPYTREAAVVGFVNLDAPDYRDVVLAAAEREREPVVRDALLQAAALW